MTLPLFKGNAELYTNLREVLIFCGQITRRMATRSIVSRPRSIDADELEQEIISGYLDVVVAPEKRGR